MTQACPCDICTRLWMLGSRSPRWIYPNSDYSLRPLPCCGVLCTRTMQSITHIPRRQESTSITLPMEPKFGTKIGRTRDGRKPSQVHVYLDRSLSPPVVCLAQSQSSDYRSALELPLCLVSLTGCILPIVELNRLKCSASRKTPSATGDGRMPFYHTVRPGSVQVSLWNGQVWVSLNCMGKVTEHGLGYKLSVETTECFRPILLPSGNISWAYLVSLDSEVPKCASGH